MKYSIKILLLIILTITSCKTHKNVVSSGNVEMISTKKIIKNHYDNFFNQNTLSAKLVTKYKGVKTSLSFNIKLRLEKDKTIWMSATKLGFPVAKIIITPNEVRYYEKLKKTYFEGDFSLLSKWMGVDLDFDKVQNLFLGQTIMNLKKGRYNSEIKNEYYQINPKKNSDLFSFLFLLNPDNFKLNKVEFKKPEEKQLFQVSYPKYKEIKGEEFPEKIHITAIDNTERTTINIDYKSIEFNKKLTFPFSIPSGYKEIILK